jgi:hypothetical protein
MPRQEPNAVMQSPSQMQSLLQLMDVEMRRLILRFNVVRCRNLLDAETDTAKRQQLHYFLNAARYAEARFLISDGRACEFDADMENSQNLTAPLSLDDELREPQKHEQTSNVIDFDAARKSHVNRARRSRSNGSAYFARQWPLMSNAEQARRIAAFTRVVSRRLAIVKQAAEFRRSRRPSE